MALIASCSRFPRIGSIARPRACACISRERSRPTRTGRRPELPPRADGARMNPRTLTLLQRGVIQRLRDAGYPSIADRAREAWTRGERDETLEAAALVCPPELKADFKKANAGRSATLMIRA